MVGLVSTGTLENHLVSPVTSPVSLEDLGRGPTDTGGHVAVTQPERGTRAQRSPLVPLGAGTEDGRVDRAEGQSQGAHSAPRASLTHTVPGSS